VTQNPEPQRREATITVRVQGAPTRRIQVSQPGTIWNSHLDVVGYWRGPINLYTRTLPPVSNTFRFPERVAAARSAWGDALGIRIGTTSSRRNAQIVMIGGTRAEIAERENVTIDEDIGGEAHYGRTSWSTTRIRTGNRDRHVHRFTGQTLVFVVDDRNVPANITTDLPTITTIHELGHALGYFGHSENSQHLMYKRARPNRSLSAIEIRHLRQIYDSFGGGR